MSELTDRQAEDLYRALHNAQMFHGGNGSASRRGRAYLSALERVGFEVKPPPPRFEAHSIGSCWFVRDNIVGRNVGVFQPTDLAEEEAQAASYAALLNSRLAQ